jgi:hypothetical protein
MRAKSHGGGLKGINFVAGKTSGMFPILYDFWRILPSPLDYIKAKSISQIRLRVKPSSANRPIRLVNRSASNSGASTI